MKNFLHISLSRLCFIAGLFLIAGFIQPEVDTINNFNSEKNAECIMQVPFLIKISGMHVRGHICGENDIRKFHGINFDILPSPKDPVQVQKPATQSAGVLVFLNWQ